MQIEEHIDCDPEDLIVKLLNAARGSVWTSSSVVLDFFKRDRFKQAMENAAERTYQFWFLLDNDVDWEEKKSELPWLAGLVTKGLITVRKSKEPIPHWLIIDGRHFRLEKRHPPGKVITNNLEIWGAVKPLADMLQDRFRSWWENATPVG